MPFGIAAQFEHEFEFRPVQPAHGIDADCAVNHAVRRCAVVPELGIDALVRRQDPAIGHFRKMRAVLEFPGPVMSDRLIQRL